MGQRALLWITVTRSTAEERVCQHTSVAAKLNAAKGCHCGCVVPLRPPDREAYACREYVTDKLVVGKWVLLWIVLAECVSLCAAGALLWLRPEANPYADMSQEQVRPSNHWAA